MNGNSRFHAFRCLIDALALLAVCSCGALRPTATPLPALYSLENPPRATLAPAPASAPTLVITPPSAAAGFDSSHIVYVRKTHQLEYFAHSAWIDPPARMLPPLIVAALENAGAFHAVLLAPSAAIGDFRLDTKILRLQHEFQTQPSRVRFTLRADLVDNRRRRVLASREFDGTVPAASDDPYGGVVAANRAVHSVLGDLATFCGEAIRNWQSEP